MRWEGLFADLEAQFDAAGAAERAAEVEDRARMELGRLGLQDRLRAGVGASVRLRLLAHVAITGALRKVGPDWLLVDEGGGREAVVVTAAVLSVSGLGRWVAAPQAETAVQSRLGLGHALRGIARDRSAIRVGLTDGSVVDGTVDRVGRDFLELATHGVGELRRRDEVRDVLVVAFTALAVLRRDS